MPRTILLTALMLSLGGAAACAEEGAGRFDPDRDLLSLHYDHAPDRDDGHSAVADRAVLRTLYGDSWIAEHAVAVSGAYGENAPTFNDESDAVMDATFNAVGGWLDAHEDHASAVEELAARWKAVLKRGGDVWVKEGGQSDITAEVVQRLKEQLPGVDFKQRVHVVQHSDWNEDKTTDAALAYAREETDYIRIADANSYLNRAGGDDAFERSALAHPLLGEAWAAAFEYYPPSERLDFSDTGELHHILGLGEPGFDAFRERFLNE